MVGRTGGTRRGASTLGCLVTLVLFMGALYYGTEVGRIYYRYYSLVDVMKVQARFARNQTDQVIRRNILSRIDDLGLPSEARRLLIRRDGPPYQIVIRTQYRELLQLPFRSVQLTFRPKVESRF
ncbi:MAG: hypothetical protein AAB075_04320 [Gemmatimonadota bacterium]